jgi:L-fuculose-phosphate aldolase
VPESHDAILIRDLVRAAAVLTKAGCLTATDGNFSARLSQDRALVTRSGVEKRNLCEGDLVQVEIADLSPASGSSEWPLHRALYLGRPEVACVLHVHAPYLTTFAVAHRVPEIRLLSEAVMTVPEIVLIPYFSPGSQQLGDSLLHESRSASVYLLANHGCVAVGKTVTETLHRLERAEFLARIEYQCLALGGGVPLTPAQASLLTSLAPDR